LGNFGSMALFKMVVHFYSSLQEEANWDRTGSGLRKQHNDVDGDNWMHVQEQSQFTDAIDRALRGASENPQRMHA
jgi:hypothetical protein